MQSQRPLGNGVYGIADPAAALALLLARTGLEYRFVNPNTVVIRAAADSEPAGSGKSRQVPPRQSETGAGSTTPSGKWR